MESFRTLRGFIDGHENDESSYFAYSACLRIFAEALDLDAITHEMGIVPTATHRKGDRKGPRSPEYRHDMWTLDSRLPEESPLAAHIDSLWSAIQKPEDYLRGLKTLATVDVFLGYRSNIDNAGLEIPYRSLEMFRCLEIPLGISIIVA